MEKKVLKCHTTMRGEKGEQLLTYGKDYGIANNTKRDYTIVMDNGKEHVFNKRKDAEYNSYMAWLE